MHARFLDDADDLADTLGTGLVDCRHSVVVLAVPGRGSRVSSGSAASPNSASRHNSSSLAARPSATAPAESTSSGRSSGRSPPDELDGALNGRVDGGRRCAEPPGDQRLQLVHDRLVALGGEHVNERLGGENLADGRRKRRRAHLGANPRELVEHLVDAIACGVRTEMDVERGHQPGWQRGVPRPMSLRAEVSA